MDHYPFGNNPAKVERYQKFWNREIVSRPLIGFSIKSWFPLEEFAASRTWQSKNWLSPDMVIPQAFMDDQERLLREGEHMDDDILRGACPSQAVPWLCGMLGSQLRILPGNVLAQAQTLSWAALDALTLDRKNAWFKKYIDFAKTLVERANGRFAVSHGTLIGPTDLLGAFRGHTQSLMDLIEAPEQSSRMLWKFGEIFCEITKEVWKHIPPFYSGYFDAQYQLWAPGPIIRMQEDAIAIYSPKLYRDRVQSVDRALAKSFKSSFMHLHSTSMFILDALLEIEELRCFQVNYEVSSGGPAIQGMIPYFCKIQKAKRSLIIRGSFTPEEMRVLVDALDPRGLYIYVMVNNMREVEVLRPILGM